MAKWPTKGEKKFSFHALKDRLLSGDGLVAFISVLKKIVFFFINCVSNFGLLRILVVSWI